jgi:hypothetical protein
LLLRNHPKIGNSHTPFSSFLIITLLCGFGNTSMLDLISALFFGVLGSKVVDDDCGKVVDDDSCKVVDDDSGKIDKTLELS